MRTATIVVLALVAALAAGSVIPPRERKVADKDFLIKQKNIIQLLIRPHQQNLFTEQVEIGNAYDLEASLNNYRDTQEVKRFLALYKHNDLLPRGEVFSVLYRDHIWQVERLFNIFFLAKDYDTFYKTACWARDRVNEGMFVYAFSVAVLHRPDTQDIILPPPYEVYPELFVDTTVIQKAYEARMSHQPGPYVIPYNYTSHVHNYLDRLNYFSEDVGLNTYLTYLNYEYPAWLNTRKYGLKAQHRGELFYYTRQQLLARYQLERLSRGFPSVETFDTNIYNPVKVGFNPHLHYPNGQAVPARPEGIRVHDNDLVDVDEVKNIEWRIRNAIDSHSFIANDVDGYRRAFINETDGIEVLGNIIQGNADSLNKLYFKSYFGMLLSLYGHIVDPEHELGVAPSALEHFETALRDPIYYNILYKVVDLFNEYKRQFKSYTRDQLAFPGVKIESVDVDKLITYYDDFFFNLNNAVEIEKVEEADSLDIRVRQQRLNHKPFTVRVNVNSDKAAKVMVRFYLAPKFDYLGRELTLNQKRKYAVELDRFPYEIVAGSNVIERSSRDSNAVVHDQLTTNILLKKVNQALEGKEPLYIGSAFRHCGFPERLLIPHGRKSGLPLNFFVVITPYEGQDINTHPSVVSCGTGLNYDDVDTTPLGYPFDRTIWESSTFFVPNIYQKDVLVYHKTQEEINNP
ncbi:hexamerin [Anabrus simplex]|uniref:hexamerin n=1 Tax=Anabrus simplex TaxID=316456 RepID=UPI0035A3B739